MATDPTLVLAGDDDPIVPLVNGRILARRIADSRLHVVAGGGHFFLLERPAEIATVVADFLTPLGSAGAPRPARPPQPPACRRRCRGGGLSRQGPQHSSRQR